MYTKANQNEHMYLRSAKTEDLSINFLFESYGTQSKIQEIKVA